MKEKPNYYAIIPANVRYDKRLSDKAKLLYGEIVALSDKNGYCYATNKYFSELYSVTPKTISSLIKQLIDLEYIKSEIVLKENSQEIASRNLSITIEGYGKNFLGGMEKNFHRGMEKNVIGNNTSINNTSKENKISKDILSKKVFKKPTIEEIKDYCQERKNSIRPEVFYDFYESKGWVVGKSPMKDWKAAVRTWEKSRTNNKNVFDVPNWFNKDFSEKDERELSEEDYEFIRQFEERNK